MHETGHEVQAEDTHMSLFQHSGENAHTHKHGESVRQKNKKKEIIIKCHNKFEEEDNQRSVTSVFH